MPSREELASSLHIRTAHTLTIDDLAFISHKLDHASFMIEKGFVSEDIEYAFYYGLVKTWRHIERYIEYE
jgi:hypothetical protein